MAYHQNSAANTGEGDFKVSVNTAYVKSKAKEKKNPSPVLGSLQSIFGIDKGAEFSLNNGGKEKKYRAIIVAHIQVMRDDDNGDSSDINSIDGDVPELQERENDKDSSSDKETTQFRVDLRTLSSKVSVSDEPPGLQERREDDSSSDNEDGSPVPVDFVVPVLRARFNSDSNRRVQFVENKQRGIPF